MEKGLSISPAVEHTFSFMDDKDREILGWRTNSSIALMKHCCLRKMNECSLLQSSVFSFMFLFLTQLVWGMPKKEKQGATGV